MPKLLSEVTVDDFERSKVWVYSGESDAIATVEPSSKTGLVEDDGSVYLVATEFSLADDTVLSGFTSPTDDSGLDYVQPVIFHNGKQLALWRDDTGVIDVSADLGKDSGEVYPIHWLALALVDGEERKGLIDLK